MGFSFSFTTGRKRPGQVPAVPSILDVQKTLVSLEDKPASFTGSREWIGSFEVCLTIDAVFDVSSKILHVASGRELHAHMDAILAHFREHGSPLMMGGDADCSSKGIFGAVKAEKKGFLLVVDPHYYGKKCSKEELRRLGWVKWMPLEEFMDSSFYNLCMPQTKSLINK